MAVREVILVGITIVGKTLLSNRLESRSLETDISVTVQDRDMWLDLSSATADRSGTMDRLN